MPPRTGPLFAACCRCHIRAGAALPSSSLSRSTAAIGKRMSVASRKRFTTSATTRAQHENDDRSPYMGRGNHHDNSPRGHFDRDDRTPANTPRKTKSGQELIVIGPSRPRTAPETIETTPSPLHEGDLSNLSNALLTYETEAVLDNTRMEISLLKPQSFSKKVSKERFEQLSQQLYQSFNQLQLWSYYQNALQEGKPGAVPTPSKYAPKADLIKAILRGRWGVKIAEEIQAHDDFIEVQKLRSTRQNVFFLVGEDGRILRDWAHTLQAAISVDAHNSEITLKASRRSIEKIKALLEETALSVVSEDFDLTPLVRLNAYKEDSQINIMRMTNTYIERTDASTLRISCLGPETAAIEDARRHLLVSMDLKMRSKDLLLYNPPYVASDKGAVFPVSEASSLPWLQRNHEWGRWKLLRHKPTDTQKMPETSTGKRFDILRSADGARGGLSMIPEALKSLAGSVNQDIKSRGLKTEYDVTVGHILYTINTDDYNIRTDNYELDDTRFMASFSQKPRVLCRLFPGIPFFSQDSIRRIEFDIPPPPLQGASAREFFELGFLPSPWANPSMFENYPPLRMTIDIEPGTGAPHEPRIFALGSNAEVDVLYPRLPCDLRFSRRDECLLPVSSIAQESPAGGMAPLEWKRFMNDSQLNMAHDTKLRASSKLEVHIPSWLVYPGFQKLPAYASADASTDAPTDAAPNAARIEYTLTKMEYRREVAVSENASILTRTIVEGGNSGGRHTEIKLRYDPPHSSPSPLEAAPVDPHHDDDDEVSFGIEELPYDKRSPSEEFLSFVKKSVNLVTLVEDYLNRPIKQARKQAKKQAKK